MGGYVKLELLRTVRDSGYLIIAVIMPVVLYLIFSSVGVVERTGGTHLHLMVAMAAFGACGAAFNNGTGVAEDATAGWLRQLRVTPLGPLRVVTAKALVGMVVVLPSVVCVLLAGGLVMDVRLTLAQWLGTGLLLWLGVAPIVLFGLGNGYLFTGQTAQAANIACNLGLAIVGGLWLPTSDFPGWLASLSVWTPTHAYADVSWRTVFDGAPTPGALALLGLWLVLFCGYAVFGFRRSTRTA